ncbi:hypothetical protein NNJEOMEG_01767 [Fundidesulfovibrio magnetotacticus]|uniref:DUF1656 domain-containing protein n=1 Tax=Fundidesulfovibrio magnetotacticus TaxID=2730080 RepID=A0A6V8LUZ0_9BACT|nr:DUF1656 domain-containing protein [Fundidesulfovibrio magnetotacticus]GFK93929.1 hypothetical protein NNJEOMEG_01767 [Fundidesulfovibrio magnetotacticus]
MFSVPHEIDLFGIYFPPFFLASALGVLATCLLAWRLNALRLSRYFTNPALAFLAVSAILACLFGTFVLPS